jgi:hypothetical protein
LCATSAKIAESQGNMDDKLTIVIAITAAAVVLQMFFLAAMAFSIRRLATLIETAKSDAEARLYPVLENARPVMENIKHLQDQAKSLFESSSPKVNVILDNVAHVTSTTRGNLDRVDATVNDVIDRVRLQVIRADEMTTRAMDRVEETTEKVHHTVLSPVRQVSGILSGITAGMNAYFSGQKRPRNGGPNEEMFI